MCEKCGIGRSTVEDIKRNREKILKFKRETIEMGMSKKAKVTSNKKHFMKNVKECRDVNR